MGPDSRRPVRVPMLTPVHCQKQQAAVHVSIRTGPQSSGRSKMVQEWFDDHNNQFEVLTWPPNSPDLNPVQHVWDVLNKQVPSMEAPPRNLQDLKDLLLTSWCQIPQHTFRDLVESMPRR
ncbi:hypothetical protein QTP86_015670, partial [Hemibagrus guttatus]